MRRPPVFHATIDASRILGVDAGYRTELDNALKRIPDLKIGKHGQLQEWSEDYDENEPGMSHVSHLLALFPRDEITLRGTPELASAARVSLERRVQNGAGRRGWPAAWYIALWARLEDGERAANHVQALLATSAGSLLNASRQVFQIDANLGAAAGIAEMLLQSHAGEVTLLPALPSAWPEGRFTGLRARGNVEVDASWANGKVVSATLRPAVSGDVRIRPPRGQRLRRIQSGDRTVKAVESGEAWLARLGARRVYRLTLE